MLAAALNLTPDRIAIAELFGAIGSPARTSEYVRMMRSIEENKRIRALVIDIDSPGGGAGASETIFRSVQKVAKKKPVVAFISGTGASGSYMAACGASKIMAVPMAIVGSIGVISMRPMLYDMLEKIGVRMEVTKAGRLKDMFSNFREPTDEERGKEQALLDAFYDRFVDLVSEARGLPREDVKAVATGEIFTAGQAKERRLIDELGDMDAAIDAARELAGLSERKLLYVRPHRSLRDRLLSGSAMSMAEQLTWAFESAIRGRGVEFR
ncbi:MAG: signal peptide peptidase SppA [Chloroflexi bacterium]|nr:signal peptide peptidase SppA [Chloroflexota bacterium]